ncbi:transcriptional regulator [Devosia riboflavina]|uniref:Transcriptional regulator n=2 Tax=Devosia riboflavina TaxID=46914 RepID=A0A087LYF5_9HYPH|nr:transcriptional regulator [Devosia riboflavina]
MALKMRTGLSSSAIGEQLGITGEAARQQLLRLAQEGLVASENISSGVGRPTQSWSLTPAAQSRFPDTHAALTVQLLDLIGSTLGDAALDTIITARETLTREAYEGAVSDKPDLKGRVAALVDLRSREGYMADWNEQPDGSLLLVENHCPICAAATACQGFCRAELEVFRAVLGPDVNVEREDHIVSGGRRCSYRITPESTS